MLGVNFSSRILTLDERSWETLLVRLGPSLALWRAAEVAALRQLRYDQPIIDAGCGDGIVSSLVLESVDYGIDLSESAIVSAADSGLYRSLLQCRAEESGLAASCAGTVISNSVLEHLEDPDGFLKWASFVLRPGGKLVFSVPSDAFSSSLAIPLDSYRRWRNRKLKHLNLWSIREWSQAIAGANLSLELVIRYMPRTLVSLWDAIDLSEQVWIGGKRAVGVLWKRLSQNSIRRLARAASKLNFLSSGVAGGYVFITAKKGDSLWQQRPRRKQ